MSDFLIAFCIGLLARAAWDLYRHGDPLAGWKDALK